MLKKYFPFFLILILILFLSLFFYFSKEKTEPSIKPEKIKVATTIFPLQDIVQNIAQDKIEVINILPSGASPHTFEVTPSQIKALEDTQIIFTIGHGLDDWTKDITQSLEEMKIYSVDSNISFQEIKDHHGHDEKENQEEEGFHQDDEATSNLDPHYWLSFKNGKIIAANITDALIELDPSNKEFYFQNLKKYDQRIDQAFLESFQKIEKLNQRELIVFHESWNYFVQDFNLEIVGVFEPTPGKEPSPQDLANLQKTVSEHNIKVIFSEPQLSPETIKPFVKDLELKLYVLDPLGGVAERNSYLDLLLYNANTISEALK